MVSRQQKLTPSTVAFGSTGSSAAHHLICSPKGCRKEQAWCDLEADEGKGAEEETPRGGLGLVKLFQVLQPKGVA